MKGLRKNKKRVLGFVLALVMVVSVITSGNMFEVKAETRQEINEIGFNLDWTKLSSFKTGVTVSEAIGSFSNADESASFLTATSMKKVVFNSLMVKATEEHVNAGYISQSNYDYSDNGYVSAYYYNSQYVINENDKYAVYLNMWQEDGYTFSSDIVYSLNEDDNIGNVDITSKFIVTPSSVSMIYAEAYFDGRAEQCNALLYLGTGADIEEAINPSTQEPTTPPIESTDLMEAFTDEILNFYGDFVGAEITNEATNYLKQGSEICPGAIGTAQFIDRGRSWWVSCAWIDSQKGVVIEIVDINDVTKSDEIAGQFSESGYYQSVPQETYQYHNGEYIIFVVIPEEYIEAGLTLDVAKAYLDKAYNEATNQTTVVEKNDYEAKVTNTTEITNKIELTKAEKEAIDSGVEYDIVLTFKDKGANATTDEQKYIETELEDQKIGTFLEIDLSKKIGAYETKLSETKGMIEITFELPQELKNIDTSVERTYSVVRYHDGKMDVLDTKYDVATGKLSFETDKFSTYAVVYSDVKASTPTPDDPTTDNPTTDKPTTDNSTTNNTTTDNSTTNNTTTSTATPSTNTAPQTADMTHIFIYIVLFALAICSVLMVLRKQRKF